MAKCQKTLQKEYFKSTFQQVVSKIDKLEVVQGSGSSLDAKWEREGSNRPIDHVETAIKLRKIHIILILIGLDSILTLDKLFAKCVVIREDTEFLQNLVQ